MKKSLKWLLALTLVTSMFAVACEDDPVNSSSPADSSSQSSVESSVSSVESTESSVESSESSVESTESSVESSESSVEEHTHTYATTWSKDATNHWYAATCEHTTETQGLAAHVDVNADGVCDVCEWSDAEHTHASTAGWTMDEQNHWKVCDDHAGAKVDAGAHVGMDADGVCDTCGYNAGHAHTYATTWSTDEFHHWYAATCGHNGLVSAYDKHVDMNDDGVCDVCAMVEDEEHTHASTAGWTNDAQNHWKVCDDHTGVKVDNGAHVDENTDGICDTCGYSAGHTHTYATTWSSDGINHWHAVTCNHNVSNIDVAAHVDVNADGVCDICQWFDAQHTHASTATEWLTDGENHWKVCDEHAGVKVDVDAHEDTDNDGVCDVCDIVLDLTHEHWTDAAEYVTDGDNHWKVCSEHAGAKLELGAHVDDDSDGKCDVCKYEDPNHTHTYEETTYTSDYNGHWYASTCGHSALIAGYEAHVDEDGDNVCDDCEHELFDSVLETVVNGAQYANSGLVTYTDGAFANNNAEFFYEFGDKYTRIVKVTSSKVTQEWYYDVDGNVVGLTDSSYGQVGTVSSLVQENLVGVKFAFGSYMAAQYGVENTIVGLYELAKSVDDCKIYATSKYVDYSTVKVYGFTFTYVYVSAYGSETTYKFAVEFGLSEKYDYASREYKNYVSEIKVAYDEIGYSTYSYSYEGTQNAGSRTATSPYDIDELIVSSYDLMQGDVVVNDGDNITVTKGSTSSLSFTFDNVVSESGDFTYDKMTVSVQNASGETPSYPYVSTYSGLSFSSINYAESGVYTVTVKTAKVTKTFTLTIEDPTLTSFEAAVNTGTSSYYATFTPKTETSLYVGQSVEFASYVNSYANSGYDYELTSGEVANVTFGNVGATTAGTNNGASCKATFNAAGTYVITLTSAEDPTMTATLTVTVNVAPTIEEALLGSYTLKDADLSKYDSNKVDITFTPASDGATSGTAVITVTTTDTSWGTNGVTTYNVDYTYNAETKKVDFTQNEEAFTDVTVTWNADTFVFEVAFKGRYKSYSGSYTTCIYKGTLTEVVVVA